MEEYISSEISLCEEGLLFHFVTASGSSDEASNDMICCFEKICQYFNTSKSPVWISNAECVEYQINILTKKHIFFFDRFDGNSFEYLKRSKASIYSTRCVLSCFENNKISLPKSHSAIYSTAMAGVRMCSSGLASKEKCKIRELVEYMCGYYTDELTLATTHLVTNTVMSNKYEKAATSNVQIIKPEWITDVWNEKIINVDQISDMYIVKPFYNLNITSTGLSAAVKKELITLIEENGGKYYMSFNSSVIDILIMYKEQNSSEKFRCASKCNIECLTPKWIYDSIDKKYALPVKNYKLNKPLEKKISFSTPTKNLTSNTSLFNADCSDILQSFNVNETASTMNSTMRSTKNVKSVYTESYKVKLANINFQQAKNAGPFLDGCKIFLCGFNSIEKETLYKIINIGGATRFDEFNTNVDHIIIGLPSKTELVFLKSLETYCILVNIDWICASIEKRQPAKENNFIYYLNQDATINDENHLASPASKKNIKAMNTIFRVPKKLEMDETTTLTTTTRGTRSTVIENQKENEDLLLNQYIAPVQQQPIPPDVINPCNTSEEQTEHCNCFDGLKMFFYGFIESDLENFISDAETAGAIVVSDNYDAEIDYLIIPCDVINLDDISVKAKIVLNVLWFTSAVQNNELPNIAYFHQPIYDDIKLFQNITIVFSTYTLSEKIFLIQLAEIMGAEVSETYNKNNKPILVCPKPGGAKFNAALKWEFPVVTSEWLLTCYEKKRIVSKSKFLVGDSKILSNFEDISESEIDNYSPHHKDVDSISCLDENMPEESTKNSAVDISTPIDSKRSKNEPTLSAFKKRLAETENFVTPEPVNRRLAAICSPSSINSPTTPSTKALKELGLGPGRAYDEIYKMFKEMNAETPKTKKRREDSIPDDFIPSIPESCTDEYINHAREELYGRYVLPQASLKRQETPLSEIRRRFLKDRLGDRYKSPYRPGTGQTQCTATQAASTQIIDENIPNTQVQAAADNHVKRLSDFIQHTRERSTSYANICNDIPESIPHLQNTGIGVNVVDDICGTEANTEAIDWQDPLEFYQDHQFKNRHLMVYKGVPRFNISCDDKESIRKKIIELNGEICLNTTGYDATCTHLVCAKPNRGEKTFSAIAAGKWVLSINYIKDSSEAGFFLNEELYEWGNPKAADNIPNVDSLSKTTARAAYRWRVQLENLSREHNRKIGAFSEFKVILHTMKKELYRNLLEAGCGEILDLKPPYANIRKEILAEATHCIIDEKNILHKADRIALENANVLCVNIMFLQACITSEMVNAKEYILK